jgi:hypothetical protein
MSVLAMVLGVAFMLAGVVVAVSPERLLSVVDWGSRRGRYIAVAMRVVTGLVLILAAPASRSPTGFRILGALMLLAGLVISLVPTDRWAEFIEWWTKQHRTLYRASAPVAILLGAFIAYAALP